MLTFAVRSRAARNGFSARPASTRSCAAISTSIGRRTGLLRLVASAWLALFAAIGVAQAGATGCEDLSGFPATSGVDFQQDIVPIFSACAGCHGQGGAAGLDLRPESAYANLVGVSATTNPGQLRVAPFDPDASVLLSAINCASPGGPSFQMPGTVPAERALIRDWIAEGAPPVAARGIPVAHPLALGLLICAVLALAWLRTRRGRR